MTSRADPDTSLWPDFGVSIWPFTGHPTAGSWMLGRVGVDNTGTMYVCTAGGSPGTWVAVAQGGSSVRVYQAVSHADSPVTMVNGKTYLVDASGGNVALTLPATTTGNEVEVKKIDASAHSVTVTPVSGNVDGSATLVTTAPNASFDLGCDGTDWWVI